MHLHILGICGTFMGGLALIARAAGHRVTGCDTGVYPPMSTQLQEQGIALIEGFEPDQLGLKPDLFIIGNVISRGNPLIEAILDAGLPYVSGPQWQANKYCRVSMSWPWRAHMAKRPQAQCWPGFCMTQGSSPTF